MTLITAITWVAWKRQDDSAAPQRPDGAPNPIDEARNVLERHTEDELGMCSGCRVLWHRLTPYPCTQVVWARAVVGRSPGADATEDPEATPAD